MDSGQPREWNPDFDSQTGLEVAAHQLQQPGLEVRNDYYNDAKELVIPKYPEAYSGIPPPHPSAAAGPAELASGSPSEDRGKKRLRIIIGAAIAVVVILAAVLGGVLGSRASRSGAAAATEGTSEPGSGPGGGNSGSSSGSGGNSTDVARPQTVRQGTALTVGGWRKPSGDVELWLFYQDPQKGLRYSRCNSTSAPAGQKTCWGPQLRFNSYARANAQLSVGLLIFGTRHPPQTELFYSGDANRLLGVGFNDLSVPPVTDDSVNDVQITTGTNSSLSSYWPWTMMQDAAGALWHVRNRLFANWGPASEWDVNKTNFTAMAGSKLALVPMSANFTRQAATVGYAIFHQAVDGKLAVGVTQLNASNPETPISWPADLPSITLPRLAPIAAFSVARADDPQQRVDTYVLYPDASSNVHMLYTDSSSGSAVWKTTQPAALRGIDKDSSIACLTFSTSNQNAANSAILLEPASEENKCYFQKGGQIMEAKLKGIDWEVTGNVPIP